MNLVPTEIVWGLLTGVLRTLLGFYAFWFVWRVLLPVLPGPLDPEDRIAPYALYFTDPLIPGWARRTPGRASLSALVGLMLVVALELAVRMIFPA